MYTPNGILWTFNWLAVTFALLIASGFSIKEILSMTFARSKEKS